MIICDCKTWSGSKSDVNLFIPPLASGGIYNLGGEQYPGWVDLRESAVESKVVLNPDDTSEVQLGYSILCFVIWTSECCAQILQWNPDSCTLMLQYRVPLPVYDSSPDSALIVLPLPHCPTGVPLPPHC